MTYSLWSRGTLIGHTDLDLPHVQDYMLMGFVEPTDAGRSALIDATGVPPACARLRAMERRGGGSDLSDFVSACDRREALEGELRDEAGGVFPCAGMRIYDLRDRSLDEEAALDAAADVDPEIEASVAHDL